MNKLNTLKRGFIRSFYAAISILFLSFSINAQSTVDMNSTVGTHTWVVPEGVTSVTFGVWGAGGGGGGTLSQVGALTNPRAGAGGGGAYSEIAVAVAPGDVFELEVGAPGQGGVGSQDGTAGAFSSVSFNGSVIASAEGGQGGSFMTNLSATGVATGLGGTTGVEFKFAGGNGGPSSFGASGAGGGGAGGSTEAGYNGSITAAGNGGAVGGGNGGAPTSVADQNGNEGIIPGGGGGGSSRADLAGSSTGGNGAPGSVAMIYCKIPDAPTFLLVENDLCEGVVANYSVEADEHTDTYTWTTPAGWNGTSETNEIGLMVGAASGDITVVANNECGTSSATVYTVNVTPLPLQPSVVTGNSTVCDGDVVTYSVENDVEADQYIWTFPTEWTGASDSNSIELTVNQLGGSILVRAENGCGISPQRVLNVTVNTLPADPSVITGGNLHCQGSDGTYSVVVDPTVTSYTWTLPADWTGTSTTNSISVTTGATSGDVTVHANNSCGVSAAQVMTVTINQISADVTVVGETLTAVQENGFYQWLDCTTGLPIMGATSISYTPEQNGEYRVLVNTLESCTAVSDCISINTISIESSMMDEMSIYPNPASDKLNITNIPSGSVVKLMDMTGKIIAVKSGVEASMFDLTDVKAGVYMLNIESKKGSKTQKVVVRK